MQANKLILGAAFTGMLLGAGTLTGCNEHSRDGAKGEKGGCCGVCDASKTKDEKASCEGKDKDGKGGCGKGACS